MKKEMRYDNSVDRLWKNPDPGKSLLLVYVVAILLYIMLGTLARAEEQNLHTHEPGRYLDEIHSGALLMATPQTGKYIPATTLHQNIDLEVRGMVVDAMITQNFRNDSDTWTEAIYVFPLPEGASVNFLQMVVDGNRVTGIVQEVEEARRIYNQARQEGKKTTLLHQSRPNIFRIGVANIPPHGSVEIQLGYIDTVKYENEIFSLRFPMVVGPRYIPGTPVKGEVTSVSFGAQGWGANTDRVPDGAEITPPVVPPDTKDVNPVKLNLTLDAGFTVSSMNSLYHGVVISQDEGLHHVQFDGQVFADRDFVFEYRGKKSDAPVASLFMERKAEESYAYLMVVPPHKPLPKRLKREVMFVLDISGSMAGASIRQAKAALKFGIERLSERDRFNVIVFNNSARKLLSRAGEGGEALKSEVLRKIDALEADGGTEISAALKLALQTAADRNIIRQVVFLTDGAVGNEGELFAQMSRQLGDNRLFTVGIGSAPNSYFMRRASIVGRGSYTHIGKPTEVEERMRALFTQLENPVVTDLKLRSPSGESLESYPDPLPDVYLGQPVVAVFKSTVPPEKLHLSGTLMSRNWDMELDIRSGGKRAGLSAVWAKRKIENLMDRLSLGEQETLIRKKVVETALKHNLVSRYTSLVAVAEEVSRPAREGLAGDQVETNLPSGWQYAKVFGTSARTATHSGISLVVGVVLSMIAGLSSVIISWRRRERS